MKLLLKAWLWFVWAFFGNDLDGVDAQSEQSKDWKPHLTGWRRRVAWWCRNPMHNFLWHVLGCVDHATMQAPVDSYRWGRFPKHNVPPAMFSWNLCFMEAKPSGSIPLPLFGWKLFGWEGYIGCRERGNFGAAFRRSRV